ncbi:MAG: AI-2E family transporter [Candidatus Woesearchaeota archaeon]|jgi:predicted PurR-regulated permease PerM|nr:AI-2E family transporter [Candidatus Woesearchaeota archaeon]
MINKDHVRYFFVILFAIVMYLSFLVIKPFITPLLISFIFAFLFHPVFKWINKRIKKPGISAGIIAIVFVLIISIPAIYMMDAAIDEAQVFYSVTRQKFISGELFPTECSETDSSIVCKVSGSFKQIVSNPELKFYINEGLKNVTKSIINAAQNFFLSIPRLLLSLFIIIFTTFYLTKDGEQVVKKIKGLLPLKKKQQNHIVKRFHMVTKAILYGYILTAIAQGSIGALAFWIVDISSPVLWGIIMAIAALVPFVGTALIWVPVVLYLLGTGKIGLAIFLFAAGLVIGNIDNIIRPKIIGNKANIHPVIVLLGVIGGLFLFGVMGFLIGPLILALFLTFLEIYETEKNEANN